MQIDGQANNQDILSFLDDLCDSDDTSYPKEQKIRAVNVGYEELVADIIVADGTWEFDDTNYTDLPIGTTDLVASQQIYSFTSDYLEIKDMRVKDVDGNWQMLRPVDQVELGDIAIEEYFADEGLPTHYDKVSDDTIKLYPTPTATYVTLSGGLKVHFTRSVDLFTTSDTTQQPAFPSTHHSLLAYKAAIPYCIKYKKDRVPEYKRIIDRMRQSLLDFYARRDRDRRRIITPKHILYK